MIKAADLMPQSKEALRILNARAEQLAQSDAFEQEVRGIPYVRFCLDNNENYGIAYQYVQQILNQSMIARPPFMPDFIVGVTNWRGALITVVDLYQFFHPAKTLEEKTNYVLIIVAVQEITLGIRIQQILGGANYQEEQLDAPLISVNVAKSDYVLGIDHSLTAILNMETLVKGLSQEIKKSVYRIGEVHG